MIIVITDSAGYVHTKPTVDSDTRNAMGGRVAETEEQVAAIIRAPQASVSDSAGLAAGCPAALTPSAWCRVGLMNGKNSDRGSRKWDHFWCSRRAIWRRRNGWLAGLYYARTLHRKSPASIGGNVAENGGVHCLKYGLTVNNVLGVRMVTAAGDIVELGGAVYNNPDQATTLWTKGAGNRHRGHMPCCHRRKLRPCAAFASCGCRQRRGAIIAAGSSGRHGDDGQNGCATAEAFAKAGYR